MVGSLPNYSELYAVSDLHIGGRPGFQILKHGPRLGKFINYVASIRPEEDVALILNGDIIDSLAEDIDGYVATHEAEKMMERIYNDDTFKPVWEALSGFVTLKKRHLLFVIGNHDIELALPMVENSIRKRLAGDDTAAQGRIVFETRGAGHACMVGSARVFCTHGNDVDSWNAVDHGALAQLAGQLNAAQLIDPSEWEPNAGTRFVIEVMNDIKKRHPFVDLLKPETEAVVPILLVINPKLISKLSKIIPIAATALLDKFKDMGLLSADADDINKTSDHVVASEIVIDKLLGSHLKQGMQMVKSGAEDTDSLLLSIEEKIDADYSAMDFVDDASAETLGWFGMLSDRLKGMPKNESLRRALLDWLKNDETFHLDRQDRTYKKITKRVGSEVDFIITGHTHLERAIPINGGGQGYYYNCGTWIRLMRLNETVLKDAKAFEEVYRAITAGSIEALDTAIIPIGGGDKQPLILSRSATVRVSSQDDGVFGELFHIEDKGADEISLKPVQNTKFRK